MDLFGAGKGMNMKKPALSELLAKHGAPAAIPDVELRAAGYERVVTAGVSANASVVQIRRIDAPQPKPPAPPRRGADGRLIPNPDWAWGSGPENPAKRRVHRG